MMTRAVISPATFAEVRPILRMRFLAGHQSDSSGSKPNALKDFGDYDRADAGRAPCELTRTSFPAHGG